MGSSHDCTGAELQVSEVGQNLRDAEVLFEFRPLNSAPGRIRTCAHGSGGRSCSRPLPGKTRAGVPVGSVWGAQDATAGSGCSHIADSVSAGGRPSWSAALWSTHTGAVNGQQHDDADPLAAATEEGEAGR